MAANNTGGATNSASATFTNIRTTMNSAGLKSLNTKAGDITTKINEASSKDLSQVELLNLQQKTSEYNNMVSMMTNIFKNLYDTDKEVIRNA